MLQIDHVYDFLYENIFKDFDFFSCPGGVVETRPITIRDISIFTQGDHTTRKIMFYDQEPLLTGISDQYLDLFNHPSGISMVDLLAMSTYNQMPFGLNDYKHLLTPERIEFYAMNPDCLYKIDKVLVTSEKSPKVDTYAKRYGFNTLYYFYHGFAALDWYRGHYALNYNKSAVKTYKHDFVSYNRIINHDRSYRIYMVSKLLELNLLGQGLVSFNVTDNIFDDWRDEVADPQTKLSEAARIHAERHLVDIDKLIIDSPKMPGSVSADIPRNLDALWNIVTETVFYYDKLHLTEKIFKPIVSKQPFMLVAAPGNLAYLRSYGFKTFSSVIDESYDDIKDNDARIDAVAKQLQWYCNLSPREKLGLIEAINPIIEHNFHHFYGDFKHIITKELIDNTKTLFKEIGYDDSNIAYENIYRVLTN